MATTCDRIVKLPGGISTNRSNTFRSTRRLSIKRPGLDRPLHQSFPLASASVTAKTAEHVHIQGAQRVQLSKSTVGISNLLHWGYNLRFLRTPSGHCSVAAVLQQQDLQFLANIYTMPICKLCSAVRRIAPGWMDTGLMTMNRFCEDSCC